MVDLFPSAESACPDFVASNFLTEDGDQLSLKQEIQKCSTTGPLCVNCVTQIFDETSQEFGLLSRVVSGSISQG